MAAREDLLRRPADDAPCILGAVYCWWQLDNPDAERNTSTAIRRALWWAVGIGLCCGLAIGTKFGAGIIVPILGLAGAATVWRRWRGGMALRDVAAIVGGAALALAVPVALVGLYNWVRFASPLETGYGGSEVGAVQQGDFWGGFSGLIFSPGKGILLFSPPVILGLLAWWPFARRHLRLALVAGALVIAHVVFYARVPQWDGGTCWGPRYLDFIVPLLILPLPAGLAWLAGRGRALRLVAGGFAALLIAFALVVQLLGVLVNFDTSYNRITTGRRYWTPENSPPLVHAQILRERVAEWWAISFPSEDGVIPERAIVPENDSEPIWPRYLPRETTLRVHANGSGQVVAALTFEDARARREPPQRFTITVNGRPVGDLGAVTAPEAGPNAYRLSFNLRADGGSEHDFRLMIRNELFALLGPSRTLSVDVSSAGAVIPLRRPPAILGFPGDTPERWAWFFSERNQHLGGPLALVRRVCESPGRLLAAAGDRWWAGADWCAWWLGRAGSHGWAEAAELGARRGPRCGWGTRHGVGCRWTEVPAGGCAAKSTFVDWADARQCLYP